MSKRDGEARSLLRLPEVRRRVGLSNSEIYRRIAAGTFPAPIKLGPQMSAWPSDVIDRVVEQMIASAQGRAA